jgi:cysteine desulfurase family protein (TIGR01976 family)
VTTVEDIRDLFPALRREESGMPVAYFDGPGGTQVPHPVVEAMTDYLYHHNANTYWAFPSSAETDAAIAGAREALGDFLNASPDEIAFGANMTTLTFHLARALGRDWNAGDEVIITELDHHANVAPWQALVRERGITLRTVRMDAARGVLDLDDLARAWSPRTKLLAIGAASNALGTITDVAAATRQAHERGALVFVDAVHYAPHVLVDVREIGCDFLGCSAYKFYGPHIGVLYAARERLAALDVPKLAPAPNVGSERLETGTLNHEGIVGAGAAVDYLASLGDGNTRREQLASAFTMLHERGQSLFARLWDGLGTLQGVRRFGVPPHAPRTPTIGFVVDGVSSERVAKHLADRGVFASNGDFYASTVIERLGFAAEGIVRAGCACYTTESEVDRLVEGVAELTKD